MKCHDLFCQSSNELIKVYVFQIKRLILLSAHKIHLHLSMIRRGVVQVLQPLTLVSLSPGTIITITIHHQHRTYRASVTISRVNRERAARAKRKDRVEPSHHHKATLRSSPARCWGGVNIILCYLAYLLLSGLSSRHFSRLGCC